MTQTKPLNLAANQSKESHLRLLLDNVKDYAFIVTDVDGRIVQWDGGAQTITGWSAEQAIGQSASIIFAPEDRAAGVPLAEIAQAMVSGRAEDKRWHVRKDGTCFFADGVIVALYSDGTLQGFAKMFRDSTKDRRQQALADGQHRALELAVTDAPIPVVLEILTRASEEALPGTLASILLVDPQANCLRHGAAPSLPAAYNAAIDGITIGANAGCCGTAAFTGKPVIVTDIQIHPLWSDYKELAAEHGLRACWSMPILTPDNIVLGTFAFYSRDVHAPTVEEQECMKLLCNTATLVLDRTHVARQREAAEERARLATDAAQLGIFVWHIAEDRVYWENERIFEIFGLPKTAEPINAARFAADYVHPDDVEAFQQSIEKALTENGRLHFEGRFYRQGEREIRWTELTGILHRHSDGAPDRVVGTVSDITERKLAEAAILDAQTRLQSTLTAGEVATWVWDIRADRVTADANLARLFNVSEQDAIDGSLATYLEAIHPDDIENASQLIEAAIASGQPYEATYRVRTAQGEFRDVIARGTVEYDVNGAPIRLPGVILDITSQKQAEEALRRNQDRYQTVIESIDEGFCVLQVIYDDDGKAVDYRFLETNPAFEKQSGLTNAAGKRIKEIAPNIEPHWIEIYGRVAMTGDAIRLSEHSGELGRWFDVYAVRLGDPDERKVALLFKDITEQKRTEESLRQVAADLSATNQRKTQFLATLAHELRNPLAPIRTGLELLRLAPHDPANIEKIRAMLQRQVNQMVHLIDDLMDVARINSGKVELQKKTVSLKSIVNDALEASQALIESKGHHLTVHFPERELFLDADPVRLSQVLGNLLVNAAKYTPKHGTIDLSVVEAGNEAVISVADSGIGISSESLPFIFDMFTQVGRDMARAHGGLGIGLSLVKSLVELHDGVVTAASPGLNRGSTFTIRLPLAVDQTVDESLLHDNGKPTGPQERSLRILIADDNVDAAHTLAAILEISGHATQVAHDGTSAYQIAMQAPPDVAILDIGMPRMNGYEVAQLIKHTRETSNVVLVALTGWGSERDRELAKEAGFDFHLTKPADLDSITQLLDKLT